MLNDFISGQRKCLVNKMGSKENKSKAVDEGFIESIRRIIREHKEFLEAVGRL